MARTLPRTNLDSDLIIDSPLEKREGGLAGCKQGEVLTGVSTSVPADRGRSVRENGCAEGGVGVAWREGEGYYEGSMQRRDREGRTREFPQDSVRYAAIHDRGDPIEDLTAERIAGMPSRESTHPLDPWHSQYLLGRGGEISRRPGDNDFLADIFLHQRETTDNETSLYYKKLQKAWLLLYRD